MSNIKKPRYSNEFKLNIGTIIFIIIFIYLFIRIIISLQKETLSIYEVQNSYIDTNISTTALIVRDEKLINADTSGYVSYFVRDGEKVGKDKPIYSIDETGKIHDQIKESQDEAVKLSEESLSEIRSRISNFENYFDYSDFSDVYNFHYDIVNAVMELSNEASIEQLTSLDENESNSGVYKKVYSSESGIVTYYQDGYEDFNVDNFKADDISKTGYAKQTLKTDKIINSGEPVYKLITSENWSLIAPVSDGQAKMLEDKDTISINIHNSSKNIRCNFELNKVDDKYFVIISLNQQMVNYINDRFVDIVIAMDQNNGLKIPNTSITKKKVYKVPLSMFSNGSDSMDADFLNVKLLDEKGEVTLKQVEPTVYKKDKNYAYIDPNDFSADTVLTNTDGSETLSLSQAKTSKIQGVYCVNQGIATFRYIDILYQDDEYTIVKDNVDYSIAWYDRIVLNQKMVSENQIIK
ncbi:MAG: HlyD family efflux transporter periplasmic adaptor subunit [Lachnospiraceae bacterium]